MFDAFAACNTDIEQAIVVASGLGDQGSRCLSQAISSDLIRDLMVATITNPDAGTTPPSAADREFERILARCSQEDAGT
jgi:hypothetical protein